jgi:hypothetical protein
VGYAKLDPAGRDVGNSRNGMRAKTVLTEIGPVQIEVPRDRDSSSGAGDRAQAAAAAGRDQPDRAVADCRRADYRGDRSALGGGLWRQGQQGHDLPDHRKVMGQMAEWCNRLLDRVYLVPFAVAIMAFKEGLLIMTEEGARSLRRGELEPLADLIERLGLTEHFSGDAVMHGNDPVIRSPHRLGEASCTAQLLIGTAGAAIWEARDGTRTDISMDIIHALHYLHQTQISGKGCALGVKCRAVG